MASPDVEVAVGYSIASDGSNSGWCSGARILDVTPPASEVEAILTSHQGMKTDATPATTHTYIAGDIKEGGELTFQVYHQQDSQPVVGASNEGFTLTYPDEETAAFDGFVLSYTPDQHAHNTAMMAAVVIKVSGNVT